MVEITAARRAPTAVFFGGGLGPIVSGSGNAQFGAKVFAGAEFFHLTAVPVQMAFELIMKICPDDAVVRCPVGEKQTWVAGRLGLRL